MPLDASSCSAPLSSWASASWPFGLGARSDSALSGLLIGLVALLLSASPLLFGPSLRQTTIGRWFDAVNPVRGLLNALDAVIVDSQPLAAQSASFAYLVITWLILTTIFALSGPATADALRSHRCYRPPSRCRWPQPRRGRGRAWRPP